MKILVLLVTVFQIGLSQVQNAKDNKIDSSVKIAISRSEEALYDADFAEARDIVQQDCFKNFAIELSGGIETLASDLNK